MVKKVVFSGILILIILFFSFQFMQNNSISNITTSELSEKMKTADNNVVFIDVREPDEYAAGHIDGMNNLPLSILSDENADFPKDAEVVIICRSGNRSMQAAEKLQSYGYKNLINVQGGMNDWHGEVIIK